METKGRGINKEKRRKLELAYKRAASPLEKAFAKKISEILENQGKQIASAFRKSQNKKELSSEEADKRVAKLIDNLVDWGDVASEMFMSLLPNYILAGETGNKLFNQFYRTEENKILFSVIREDYLTWINEYGAQQCVLMTDTTKKITAMVIKNGFVEGDTTEKIARSISKTVGIAQGRARVIAGTEIHNTIMRGNFLTAKSSGFKKKKWLTVADEAVRGNNVTDKFNHVILNNQTVGIDDRFSNGLEYPGDLSGQPGDIINCRCILYYL